MKHYIKWTLLMFLPFTALADHGNNCLTFESDHGNPYINVSIYFSECKTTDTLRLFLVNTFYRTQENSIHFDSPLGKDSLYSFHIPVHDSIGYFEVGLILNKGTIPAYETEAKTKRISPSLLWQSGDSILIRIIKKKTAPEWETSPLYYYNFYFTGIGYNKYRIQYSTDSALQYTNNNYIRVFDNHFNYINPEQQSQRAALEILSKHKKTLPKIYYEILKADILSYRAYGKHHIISNLFRKILKTGDTLPEIKFKAAFNASPEGKYINPDIQPTSLVLSKDYCYSQLLKLQTEYYITHKVNNPDSIFYMIKKRFSGVLRDYLLVNFFLQMKPNNANSEFDQAMTMAKNKKCIEILKDLKTRLPGIHAYPFSLSDTSGHLIRLSNFKGKVILMDFWFTGCGGCASYYQNVLSKVELHFKDDTNVVFIAVCIDRNKKDWSDGIKSGEYTSMGTINLYTKGNGIVDPIVKYYRIQEYPTALLIDPKGNIYMFNTSNLYKQESLINCIVKAANGN